MSDRAKAMARLAEVERNANANQAALLARLREQEASMLKQQSQMSHIGDALGAQVRRALEEEARRGRLSERPMEEPPAKGAPLARRRSAS